MPDIFFRVEPGTGNALINGTGFSTEDPMMVDWGDGTVDGPYNYAAIGATHGYAADDPDLTVRTYNATLQGTITFGLVLSDGLNPTPMAESVPDPDSGGGGLIDFVGCEWPIDDTCLPDEWANLDPAVQERSLALASNTLRRLTGYRVGGCPITVRPCRQGCMYTLPYGAPYPYGSFSWFLPRIDASGAWVNGCGCVSECSCTALCEVALPGPVGLVDEVKVDGTVVPPTDYLMYGTNLTWVGAGECGWPTCQDLTLPDTEPGTFSVTYLNSYPVDGLGAYAAGVLAWEYAQACIDGVCRLPVGVTAVTRQGISYEIPAGAFPDGFTGIREVDAYIALWNPKGITREALVWSPDLPRVRHL